MNPNEACVHAILANRKWYSYSERGIMKKCGWKSRGQLYQAVNSLAAKIDDRINFFTFNNVAYIGLESRRLAYEIDKKNGTNEIEKLIEGGYYD